MSGPQHRPRYADVVGTLALVVAMSGTAYAAHALPKNSVGSKQLKDGKVAGRDVKDGGIGAADLAAGSVGTTQLAGASVTGAQLANAAVGPAAVGANAISTTVSVKDHTLTLADLVGADRTGAVTTSLPGLSCTSVIATVTGAEVGQFAVVGLAGAVAIPNVVFSPARIEVADQVTFRVCNPTSPTVSVSNLGIRVVTFG